nr:945_t:CDS:2 [Entrophospora candida]
MEKKYIKTLVTLSIFLLLFGTSTISKPLPDVRISKIADNYFNIEQSIVNSDANLESDGVTIAFDISLLGIIKLGGTLVVGPTLNDCKFDVNVAVVNVVIGEISGDFAKGVELSVNLFLAKGSLLFYLKNIDVSYTLYMDYDITVVGKNYGGTADVFTYHLGSNINKVTKLIVGNKSNDYSY